MCGHALFALMRIKRMKLMIRDQMTPSGVGDAIKNLELKV